jgi:hypothetical protein
MKKIILMKTIIYLILVIFMTSCSLYNVTGQSPYQYTSVSEQIVLNDNYDIQNTHVNYTPILSFVDYYSWYWWRPNGIFYYWGCNSWIGWNYYGYYPYYLNSWSYYNNLCYTYNPYFYHPNQGFNNLNLNCHSPFYKKNTQSLNQPQVNLQKLTQNKSNFSSSQPQPVKTLSDNYPRITDNLSQRSYERPKKDLKIYNEQRYITPSRKTKTRTYTNPERSTYQRQERTYHNRSSYKTPRSSSYNSSPIISSPSIQPSRPSYQPRTNYGGSRSNYGVKGGR